MAHIPIQIPWTQKPPLGVPIDWSNPLAERLVGAWAFNEGGGSKACDSGPNENHGVTYNSPVWTPDQALKFTIANSNYISIANNSSLEFQAKEFTVIFKFSGASLGEKAFIVGKGGLYDSYTTCPWAVYLDYPAILYYITVASSGWVSTTRTLTANKVYTAAITFKRGVSQILYLDGVEFVNTDISGYTHGTGNSNYNVVIGSLSSSPTIWFFGGSIYYINMFKRCLSAQEISKLYENPWQIYQPRTIWVPVSGGIARHFTGLISAQTSTSAAILTVTRDLLATIVVASASSSAALAVTRDLSAQAAASIISNTSELMISRGLLGQIVGQTISSNINLAITRDLSAWIAAETITSEPALSVALLFAASIAAVTTTSQPDLAISRSLSAAISGQTVTADTAAMTIAHELTARIAAGINTSAAILAVTREMSALVDTETLTSAIRLIIASLGLIDHPSTLSATARLTTRSATAILSTESVTPQLSTAAA